MFLPNKTLFYKPKIYIFLQPYICKHYFVLYSSLCNVHMQKILKNSTLHENFDKVLFCMATPQKNVLFWIKMHMNLAWCYIFEFSISRAFKWYQILVQIGGNIVIYSQGCSLHTNQSTHTKWKGPRWKSQKAKENLI